MPKLYWAVGTQSDLRLWMSRLDWVHWHQICPNCILAAKVEGNSMGYIIWWGEMLDFPIPFQPYLSWYAIWLQIMIRFLV